MLLKHVSDIYGHMHVLIVLREGFKSCDMHRSQMWSSHRELELIHDPDLTRVLGMCSLTL